MRPTIILTFSCTIIVLAIGTIVIKNGFRQTSGRGEGAITVGGDEAVGARCPVKTDLPITLGAMIGDAIAHAIIELVRIAVGGNAAIKLFYGEGSAVLSWERGARIRPCNIH
jgi:hypothetical protein